MRPERDMSVIGVASLELIALILTVPTQLYIEDYLVRTYFNNIIYILTVVLIFLISMRYRRIGLLELFASSIIFLLLSVALGTAALFIAVKAPFLAHLLGYPLTSVGYYPPGIDMPFQMGAGIWAISIMIVLNTAGAIAIGINKLRLR